MIERFNFYDVYGNLIPGVVLVFLLILPYGIATHHWPDTKLASVAVVLVLAYLVGHLIQALATRALPSRVDKDSKGRPAFPSVIILDANDRVLSKGLKARIAKLVQSRFQIELHVELTLNDSADHDAYAEERRSAFFLSRPLSNKTSAYAEQFQGLYALMRGLTVIFAMGAAYDLGWLLSFSHRLRSTTPNLHTSLLTPLMMVMLVLSVLLLLALAAFPKKLQAMFPKWLPKQEPKIEQITLVALGAVLLAVGERLGATTVSSQPNLFVLILSVFLISIFAMLRFFPLYQNFSREFAKAVWTNFAVSDPS